MRFIGSAAITLCYVAMGAIDVCMSNSLKCWDIAAGILIIKEAGGLILDSNGKIHKVNMSTKYFCTTYTYFKNIFRKPI